MMLTVKGIYRDGKVELLEPPAGVSEGEVLVTFIDSFEGVTNSLSKGYSSEEVQSDSDTPPKRMYLGMFSESIDGRQPSTEEDFKLAEFHGDDDDGLDWSGC